MTVIKQTFKIYFPKELVTLKRELEKNQQINEHKHFEQIFLEVLNTHAPI